MKLPKHFALSCVHLTEDTFRLRVFRFAGNDITRAIENDFRYTIRREATLDWDCDFEPEVDNLVREIQAKVKADILLHPHRYDESITGTELEDGALGESGHEAG